MALDLLEAIRPDIDAWLIRLLQRRLFKARDFIELPDGHVRIAPPFSHDPATTMDRWRRALAPFAEQTAHTFAALVATDYHATTPLTGRRLADSQVPSRCREGWIRSRPRCSSQGARRARDGTVTIPNRGVSHSTAIRGGLEANETSDGLRRRLRPDEPGNRQSSVTLLTLYVYYHGILGGPA
jgi:hypothetical protein